MADIVLPYIVHENRELWHRIYVCTTIHNETIAVIGKILLNLSVESDLILSYTGDFYCDFKSPV